MSRSIRTWLLAAISLCPFLLSFKPLGQNNYLYALRNFEGRSYLDVNCSQLICRAYYGFSGHRVACRAADIWYGCGGRMDIVANAGSLKQTDVQSLKPGDIVCIWHTAGIHVIAYLGNGEWIDSDPIRGGVTDHSLKYDPNDPWFNGKVRVLRWKDNGRTSKA
jgi:hypothetical protein